MEDSEEGGGEGNTNGHYVRKKQLINRVEFADIITICVSSGSCALTGQLFSVAASIKEEITRRTGRDPIQPADKKQFLFLSIITSVVETPFKNRKIRKVNI